MIADMDKKRANLLALLCILAIAAGIYAAIILGDAYANLRGPNAVSLSFEVDEWGNKANRQLLVAAHDRIISLNLDGSIADMVTLDELGFSGQEVSDLHAGFSMATGAWWVMTFWKGTYVVRCNFSERSCDTLTSSQESHFNKFTINPNTGMLYISDASNGVLRILDANGKTLATSPDNNTLLAPGDVALDDYSNPMIYVIDLVTDYIHIIAADGSEYVGEATLPDHINMTDDLASLLLMDIQTLRRAPDGNGWLVLQANQWDETAMLVQVNDTWQKVLHTWSIPDAVFPMQMDISSTQDLWIADPEAFAIHSTTLKNDEQISWQLFGDAVFLEMMSDLKLRKSLYQWGKYLAWLWCLCMLIVLLTINDRSQRVRSARAETGIGVYAMQHPGGEIYMIMSNLETIPGRRIVRHLGVVTGSTVRAKHIGRDLMAGLKNIVGGELKGYTELLQDAREEAVQRLSKQAESIGANAVLNIRFSTSSIAQGAAELFAYGTAVVLDD
ncbi:MAG: heavy metal-binding domain-containing protein [Mariprofundales bacterium]